MKLFTLRICALVAGLAPLLSHAAIELEGVPVKESIVMDGTARALSENADVKEFYLGISGEGRQNFRNMKSYRRRKRWL